MNQLKLVTAFFQDREMAERAYASLANYGIRPEEMSIIGSQTYMSQTGEGGTDVGISRQTKAPEGATTGAAVGGTVGVIAGILVAAGSLVIPGAGLVIAGPLVGALAGLGVGGAAGSILGGLIGLGVPEYEARQIEDGVRHGGIVLAVSVDASRVADTRTILRKLGGQALTSENVTGLR